jgi:pyruvate/2-oxoglutarate dehydrogenase complex dihydrolipoamide dehydrogenase (E3) component
MSFSFQLLEPSLPQLLECLNAAGTIGPALGVLLEMARESKLLQDHLDIINTCASKGCVSSNSMILAAKVFAEIGRHSSHVISSEQEFSIVVKVNDDNM